SAFRAPRRSRRRSSAGSRRGRTGSSRDRTRPARRGRSRSTGRPGSARSSTGGGPEDHEHGGARREDPEQRASVLRQALAARPRGVAAAIPRLVARDGAARLPGARRLSPHRRLGRCERLGAFRLRAHAGVPLGHLPRRAGPRSSHRLRQRLRETSVGGGAWRAPQYPPPPDRHAGRHRARLVEQQRRLGASAPSLYDLRNLLQVNVEEGRHLWAMVYLLHTYFGRDGREEAQALLQRRSGNPDTPRILGAFNEPIDDWLSFFMFTTFTDRDGKYQLLALAESGFDPLSRTCRFMLTEEAHHMFVG